MNLVVQRFLIKDWVRQRRRIGSNGGARSTVSRRGVVQSLGGSNGRSGRLFSDFIQQSSHESGDKLEGKEGAEEKVDELIQKTEQVLGKAMDALDRVRKMNPVGPSTVDGSGQTFDSASGHRGIIKSKSRPTFLTFQGSGSKMPSSVNTGGRSSSGAEDKGKEVAGGGIREHNASSVDYQDVGREGGWSGGLSGAVDQWFSGKVDVGPLLKKVESSKASLLEYEEPSQAMKTMSLEFMPPESPGESAASSIFPESLALRFETGQAESSMMAEESNEREDIALSSGVKEERTSGEEYGQNGYWYRWTEIKGRSEDGRMSWTEKWWEVSDWCGMKELGAEKYGTNAHGDAWRETWTEKIGIDQDTGKPMVHRMAHKWAQAGAMNEWEEKWGETYLSTGKADKWAEKWGRDGGDVWHEKWGESYDGIGGCVKWTDRWAESPGEGGVVMKWGDKWREDFKDGKGEKTGETWSENGTKYQRWWGENHFGDGTVQKYGNSSTGESWDVTETMDTYYNPIPHFGYDLALKHSPQLQNVQTLPRDQEIIF